MEAPVFGSTLSCEHDDDSFLAMNSNRCCDNSIEELLESFVAFTESRYMNAGEILVVLIDQYEAKCFNKSPILDKLRDLKTKCDLLYEKVEMGFDDGLESTPMISNKETSSLQCPVSICLTEDDTEDNVVKLGWNITASRSAQNTINPIRRIVDRCKLHPNPQKSLISLSIGDPTTYGNMLPPTEASEAVNEAFAKPTSHGYVPACGMEEARSAVAKLWSRDGFVLDSKDIILTSGCSHALEMCFNCIADPNDNILLPQPGFSLYLTLCLSLNIEPRFYRLIPEKNWEVDLKSMEAAINKKTKAIVVNNPSNPCGAVYSAEHLQKIIDLCEKYRLPIIVDEIYADMVFPGNKFCFMGPLSKNVPILSCGGLAKRYICPGWRVGWIAMYDRNDSFKKFIRPGLLDLSSCILGPNSVIQAALPNILANTPETYFEGIMSQIETNARICYETLSKAPGLKPIMAQGTMYMLIEIDTATFDDVDNDAVFFTKLYNEQSISCLPASVFGAVNFFRVVLTVPTDKAREACERIVQFCINHQKAKDTPAPSIPQSFSKLLEDEGLVNPEESILPFHTKSSKYK
ncbi:unnamed protein product [Rotaria magnacalcarata]|uniref:Tyrosine aminotransferase n=1 Tax=Rotaria magnacalcarata TaxID=392030 RepID=A0A816LXX2_9BILA|nr:unnamed protein product [Rotaria magnacalcarata]CAF4019880.1 unnamed protein product [Rotaria magnacalcarata]